MCVVLTILGFLLYTLTLGCALVSAEELGGALTRRTLRGDERGIHAEPPKKAKGRAGTPQTGPDPGHPRAEEAAAPAVGGEGPERPWLLCARPAALTKNRGPSM